MNVEAYLNQFKEKTENPTLEAMYWLMEKMQNPHKKCKMIHIAGTNGKGSVVETLNRILIDQGYKVGKYISPHLIRINERICVNNEEISDKEMEHILQKLIPFIEEYNQTHVIPVKYFEITTCIAFCYFASQKCDFVILEVGMGGVWDCTNIVQSIISIITSIGYDHMSLLGNTIPKIAENKAGIIKPNSDTIFWKQDDSKEQKQALDVIYKKCKQEKVNLHLIEKQQIHNYHYDENYQYFDYLNQKYIAINLKGKIQIINTCICLKAIQILQEKGYKFEAEKVKKSIKNVVHPARFETMLDSPKVIYDGAHNEPAVLNFIKNMEQYYSNKKRLYIFSILTTKDYKAVLQNLLNDENAIIFLTNGDGSNRYVTKENLYNFCEKQNRKAKVEMKELKEAINEGITKHSHSIICIVGSFYIYAIVKEEIQKYSKKD